MSLENQKDVLKQYLDKIDNDAEKLIQTMGCNVMLLVFHNTVPITRDVVDDIGFYLLEKQNTYSGKDLCLVLHTIGGDPDATYHIGVMLQNFVKENKLYVIIPRIAKSAGTMLACAGDEIYMTPLTELGPVDPQIYIEETRTWISARVVRDSLMQVLEIINRMGMSNKDIIEATLRRVPIVELGHYDSLVKHIKELIVKLSKDRMFKGDENRAKEVAEKLTGGYEYHGRVVDYYEVERIGLIVKMLSGEGLSAVYSLYRDIKLLFDFINEIKPILASLTEVGLAPMYPEKYELKHGIIYIPSLHEISS